MKNNRDTVRAMVFFEKQMVGYRDGRNQSTKIHFDSPVKIIEKKKKDAKIKRLANSEQHSTRTLGSTFRTAAVWVTQACVIFNAL